jgi:uncharacterized protein YbjT (DUF2867 family)
MLVRAGSERKCVAGALCVRGDALNSASYREAVAPCETFVHLVGTPHPAPWKGRRFRDVDLVSVQAAVDAAKFAHVRHFIYLSVAQPAPVMAAYIAVRQEGEALLRRSGLPATLVRPWYVIGPGHYWPLAVAPLYAALERLAPTRDMALRLGLVRLEQIVAVLVHAVEHPPSGVRAIGVPEIRAL